MKATVFSMDNKTQLVSNALLVGNSQSELVQTVHRLYGPGGSLSEDRTLLTIQFINHPLEDQPTDYPI
jgi:hypothetical protein